MVSNDLFALFWIAEDLRHIPAYDRRVSDTVKLEFLISWMNNIYEVWNLFWSLSMTIKSKQRYFLVRTIDYLDQFNGGLRLEIAFRTTDAIHRQRELGNVTGRRFILGFCNVLYSFLPKCERFKAAHNKKPEKNQAEKFTQINRENLTGMSTLKDALASILYFPYQNELDTWH